MDKKIKKSIFARIWQWLLNIFGLSKKDEDSSTKPASNDAGQEDVDTPSTIAEKSAEEHTAPHSSNTEQTASNDGRQDDETLSSTIAADGKECDAVQMLCDAQTALDILERVKAIENYLYVGKDILKSIKSINYSFIKNREVQSTLESDLIEMWRCRLGIRGHNQEFNQFCLYVQMQVEKLLRYYYDQRFKGDKSAIINHINFYVQNKKNKEYKKYTEIIYQGLLYAFSKEFKDRYKITSDVLDTVRILRNNVIHEGNTLVLSSACVTAVLDSANQSKVGLYWFLGHNVSIDTNSEFSFSSVVNSDSKFSDYKDINISKFNTGIKLKVLKEDKPFDPIIEELKKWCNAIQSELKNVR